MKFAIIQSKENGYCFGVKRAIDIAIKECSRNNKPIYMFGDLVHNNQLIKELKAIGIKKINKISLAKQGVVIISAHGISPKIKNVLEKNNKITIIDTTCPMVKHAQTIAKQFAEQNRMIIIFGDKSHQEVKGLKGFSGKKSLATTSINDLSKIPPHTLIGLLSQTTQNIDDFQTFSNKARLLFNDIKIVNTICQSSKNRQNQVKIISKKADIILTVGSRTSANTKRLFQISSKINKNSYWIKDCKNIRLPILKNKSKIGIIGGASTSTNEIKKIIDYIQNLP